MKRKQRDAKKKTKTTERAAGELIGVLRAMRTEKEGARDSIPTNSDQQKEDAQQQQKEEEKEDQKSIRSCRPPSGNSGGGKRKRKRIYRRSLSQNIIRNRLTSGVESCECANDEGDGDGQPRDGQRQLQHKIRCIKRSDTDYDLVVRQTTTKRPTRIVAMDKWSIATHLNLGAKEGGRWLTNLVGENHSLEAANCSSDSSSSSSPSLDDCVFLDEPSGSLPRVTYCGSATKSHEDAKRFIVDCATAAIAANFSPLSPATAANRSHIVSLLKKQGDEEFVPNRKAIYLSDLFGRYPRLQFDSSASSAAAPESLQGGGGGKQSTSTYSEGCYDLQSNFSRQQLTTNGIQQSSSLRLSIDNLKLMMEKNLIATLIAVYILVSLAIIVVLILPYIFSFSAQRQTTTRGTPAIAVAATSGGARMDQQISYQHLPSGSGSKHSLGKGIEPSVQRAEQATQTDPLPAPAPVVATSTTTDSPARQEQQQSANVTSKRDASEPMSSLWPVKHHNQRCQPLKIPFCSRSLAAILGETGAVPVGRLDLRQFDRVVYDKTLLPNQFQQARQSQIEHTLQKYEPIIDIKCYALMPLFLCSIHAPKCVQENAVQSAPPSQAAGDQSADWRTNPSNSRQSPNGSANSTVAARLVPPCRSLCKEAFRKCMFFFQVLSLKFPDPDQCDSLPESSDASICVGQLENELLQRAAGNQNCGEDKFRCTDGECISKKWRCDGFNDCTDKSDEMNCSKCNALSQFYCGADVCISKEQVCNGIRDCRDGRDERQCLRLAPAPGAAATPSVADKVSSRQQLQAWSALKDSWVPVCGSHWSATPISHQACQALGYSRANETAFIYSSPIATAGHQTHKNVTRTDDRFGRERRAPGGWFDASPSDSYTQAADSQTRPDQNDDGGDQLASIVEDVASTTSTAAASGATKTKLGAELAPVRVADHLVYYELANQQLAGQTAKQQVGLATIDAAQIKLKSLTSMLYYGPEAGCLAARPGQLVASVHLKCQNFQCGRSISSYSSRVRLLQRPAATKQYTSNDADRIGPLAAKSSHSSLPGLPQLRGSLFANNQTTDSEQRVQHLEATEELIDDSQGDEEEDGGGVSGQVERTEMMDGATEEHKQALLPISSRWVVGGIESMPGEFPYLAALHGGPDEVFFCGGVLISINWLLTAAHCVGNRTQPDGWMVKVGVTRRIASPAFVKKLKVKQIIKHPDFNQDSMFNNDIALILLEHSVEYNQYLRPICMPVANTKLGPDNSKDCVVVGFGKSKYSQEANYLHVAHFVNVPIVHHTVCSNWYAEHGVNLTEGMLCAGYAEGKRDACQGDSGSGLFCRYSNTNQFFVAGVVSFGIKCATPKLPGVYTSVPSYVNWVEQVTRQHGYPLD